MVRIGLIGGSGLEKLNIFQQAKEIEAQTPFGPPSSIILSGQIKESEVFFLSRHGWHHTITPTHVNNRANISALKELGCQYILATTACGSLRDEIHRGDVVIPDQFIDFTRKRPITFHDHFEPDKACHTAMADPFSAELRNRLIASCRELGIRHHPTGTVITIEGPRFSTRAESTMFRVLGADIVNMSIAPEAILAAEAGIPYAVVALTTDYDAWKKDEKPVTWDELLKVFNDNVKLLVTLIEHVIRGINNKPS